MENLNAKKPIALGFLDSIKSNNSNSKPSSTQTSDPYKNLPNMGINMKPVTTNASTKYNKWTPPASKDRTTFFEWYDRYLQSDEWSERRKMAISRDANRCKICNCSGNRTNPLQVHHRDYEHVGREDEDMTCLVTLCKRCHKAAHRYMKNSK